MFTTELCYKEVIQKVLDGKEYKCNSCDFVTRNMNYMGGHIFDLHVPMLIKFKKLSCKFCHAEELLCKCDLDHKKNNIVSMFQPSIIEKAKYFQFCNSYNFSIYLYFEKLDDVCKFVRLPMFGKGHSVNLHGNEDISQWWQIKGNFFTDEDFNGHEFTVKTYDLYSTKNKLIEIQKRIGEATSSLETLKDIFETKPQRDFK